MTAISETHDLTPMNKKLLDLFEKKTGLIDLPHFEKDRTDGKFLV